MKAYVYYESEDVEKNHLFIEDLIGEAKKIGMDLQLLVDSEQPEEDAAFILFRGRDYKLAAAFEKSGFRVFNNSEVNRIAGNKLSTFELAVMLGIPTVQTHQLYTAKQIDTYPVIVKTAHGHGGKDVYLCEDAEKVTRIHEKYAGELLVVQPYVETNATDIRVFVLGNEIIGAVKRTGINSFKSNYTLGGTAEKYKVSPKIDMIVAKIVETLDSDYIGIDFLLRPNGDILLNEIEDPVGARSLYVTHAFSVAEKLVTYLKKDVSKQARQKSALRL